MVWYYMERTGPEVKEGSVIIYYTKRKLRHSHADKHPYLGIVRSYARGMIHFNPHAYGLHKDHVLVNGNPLIRLLSPTSGVMMKSIDKLFVGKAAVRGHIESIENLTHHLPWINSLGEDTIIPGKSMFLLRYP